METNIYCPGCRVNELIDSPRLLSRRLQSLGYSIGYTGKWHLGIGKHRAGDYEYKTHYQNRNLVPTRLLSLDGTLPSDVGYEDDDFPGHGEGGYRYQEFHDYSAKRGLSFRADDYEKPGTGITYTDFGTVTSGPESTNEHFITDRAIDLVERLGTRDAPFYLQLNYWGPHNPQYAPAEFLSVYDGESFDPWPSFDEVPVNKPKIHNLFRRLELDWEVFQKFLRHYYAAISNIDAEIGRLIDYLRVHDQYDQTMIIFTADHGDSQGRHGNLENKAYHMYEETARVPLIVKPQGGVAGGQRSPAFTGTRDVYQRVLDAARDTSETPSDGLSWLPIVRGVVNCEWPDEVVTEGLGVMTALETQRMLRFGAYKYVFHDASIDELYDLHMDPDEINNLIDQANYRSVVREARDRLDRWMRVRSDSLRPDFQKITKSYH